MTETRTTNGFGPHIALMAVQLFFGTSTVLGKFALKAFPALSIVGFRIGGAAIAFTLLQRYRGTLALDERKHYLHFALLGFLGISLNQMLFFEGLSRTTAVNTSLIATSIPVFTIALGILAGFERMRWTKGLGIAIAVSGVFYLMIPDDLTLTFNSGDILIVLNSLSYAFYIGLSKNLLAKYGALKSIAWLFIFGCLLGVPVGAYQLAEVDLWAVSWESWLFLGGLVLFPTILAYYWNTWALARVEPSTVVAYVYFQPLIGVLAATIFLSEKLTIHLAVAAVMIFVGVYLVSKRKKIKPQSELPHLTS